MSMGSLMCDQGGKLQIMWSRPICHSLLTDMDVSGLLLNPGQSK